MWIGEASAIGAPSGTAAAKTSPAVIAARLGALGTFERSRDKLGAIASQCRMEAYRKGQSLLKSGQPSSRFLVVAEGNAAAYLASGKSKDLIEEFRPGELILYKSFFRNGGSPFDVEAASDVDVISIPVQSLESLLATDPELASEIERLLDLREEAANRVALKIDPALVNGKTDTSRVDLLRDMFRV